jgi:hypothetical protein
MKPWTCFYCGLVTEGTFHSCTHASLDPDDAEDALDPEDELYGHEEDNF